MIGKLKSFKGKKKKRRVGRGDGSGWGHTCGKGHKGQKSRSGASIPAQFEGGQMPITRRFPKRGFTNIFKTYFQVINLSDLNGQFAENDVVNYENLLNKRMIRKKTLPVKVLGNGDITKPLTVQVNAFSKSAKEAIEKAGGKAEVV